MRGPVTTAAPEAGLRIQVRGTGAEEECVDLATGKGVVGLAPRYRRPTEVDTLLVGACKAREKLGWRPRPTFAERPIPMRSCS